jgi:hypothetical protein
MTGNKLCLTAKRCKNHNITNTAKTAFCPLYTAYVVKITTTIEQRI